MEEEYNYRRIEKAIQFLSSDFRNQPSLEEIASHCAMSPFHFQRVFTEWAGVSPKKFLQYLTVESLKRELHEKENLFTAAESVGLSSPSRVYDLFVNTESVTPQEFRTGGEGISIAYGFEETPFGKCFIALTGRGVCAMSFTDGNEAETLEEFRGKWPGAQVREDRAHTKPVAESIFRRGGGKPAEVKLLLKGTPFQLKVWEALLNIPFGKVTVYGRLASSIGSPSAARAVGTAVGSNPVAFLIPCHRVIRNEGIIGQYRWGSARKTAMLGWERSRMEK
ncbi:MAG TPA: methylated-DNA--[protein]-cysteine S-methyltransferase [Bacteroidia bacterium]|nr:methylated-DNA--[protein]-cysteine S-methyltransferase [Bacteroidia bacterium]